MQEPEPERAPRVAARVRVGVLGTVCVAVEMKVRAVLVGVHVQVPAPARVSQNDRSTEPDQEQRDEKVGGGPEAIGKMDAEQHDHGHDHPDAGGMTHGPGQPQTAGVEQAALARRERRHRGEVIGFEGVAEPEEQAEAREGEEAGRHGGPQFSHGPLARQVSGMLDRMITNGRTKLAITPGTDPNLRPPYTTTSRRPKGRKGLNWGAAPM